MTSELLPGHRLVAAPTLRDPNFFRTVVLLLEHDDGGALGLVLNRPSGAAVADALPGWEGVAAAPPVVFVGGPVAPEAGICLARVGTADPPPGWTGLAGRFGTLDLQAEPAVVAPALERMRVFAGYAGWAAAQLAAEIDGGDWFVVPAEPDDAFTAAADRLWPDVLRRQGGRLAMLATFPPDPSLN